MSKCYNIDTSKRYFANQRKSDQKKKRILRVLGKQNSSLMIEVKIGVTSGLGASDWEGTQGILQHVEPRSGSRSHGCLSV